MIFWSVPKSPWIKTYLKFGTWTFRLPLVQCCLISLIFLNHLSFIMFFVQKTVLCKFTSVMFYAQSTYFIDALGATTEGNSNFVFKPVERSVVWCVAQPATFMMKQGFNKSKEPAFRLTRIVSIIDHIIVIGFATHSIHAICYVQHDMSVALMLNVFL